MDEWLVNFCITTIYLTKFFSLACGIVAAAEDSESYDTDDIDGKKIVSQTAVRVFLLHRFSFASLEIVC